MVAPLYVEPAVIAEDIHDYMRARSAVENVAKDVKLVYAQTLDHVAERDDEFVCLTCGYYGLDDS